MVIQPLYVRMCINTNSQLAFQMSNALEGVEKTIEETDEAYIIHTHEHVDIDAVYNDDLQVAPYYQVAFRIMDIHPYSIDDIYVCIDHTMYRDGEDRALVYDDNNEIWYEPTFYEQVRNKWKLSEQYPAVDSITTSGVFRIAIKDIIGNLILRSKPIYVLPNEMTFEGYQRMLRDLISINADFIHRKTSTIGIGSYHNFDEMNLKYKGDILQRAINEIKHIMKLTAVAQKKSYSQQQIYNVKRFDGRVMQQIIKNGSAGKIQAIRYEEDHDIYENRIVKFFAERLLDLMNLNSSAIELPSKESYINTNVNRSMRRILGDDPSKLIYQIMNSCENEQRFNGENATTYEFSFSGSRYCDYYNNCISVDENTVGTFRSGRQSHNPFKTQDNPYCGIEFSTTSNCFKLWILEQLIRLYNFNWTVWENKKVRITCGNCSKITDGKPELATWFCFSDIYEVQFIFGDQMVSSLEIQNQRTDLSLQEYFDRLTNLRRNARNYNLRIDIRDKRFDLKQAYFSLCKEYEYKYNILNDTNRIIQNCAILSNILNTPWMREISIIHSMRSVHATQLFISNEYYRKIYKLIHQVMKEIPFLSEKFDVNAYGVEKTEQIYEYWTFLQLITALKNLGFVICDNQDMTPDKYFSSYFFPKRQFPVFRGVVSEHAGFHFRMERKLCNDESIVIRTITIEVGFDCYMDTNGGQPSFSPDIYIKVFHPENNTVHWYFMDAKYRPLARRTGDNAAPVSPMVLEDVIGDVSIGKYGSAKWPGGSTVADGILQIQEPNYTNEIRGSYIIFPRITGEERDYLNDPEKDRLFGGDKYIKIEIETVKKGKTVKKCSVNRVGNEDMTLRAKHRYGAIILSPDDSENTHSELSILLKLIFEYLEIEPGEEINGERRYDKENLSFCWNCGYERKLQPEINLTAGGYEKYSYICPECGMLRIENHCKSNRCWHWPIIKFASGNYHRQSRPWLFYCPQCGEDGSWRGPNINIFDDGILPEEY